MGPAAEGRRCQLPGHTAHPGDRLRAKNGTNTLVHTSQERMGRKLWKVLHRLWREGLSRGPGRRPWMQPHHVGRCPWAGRAWTFLREPRGPREAHWARHGLRLCPGGRVESSRGSLQGAARSAGPRPGHQRAAWDRWPLWTSDARDRAQRPVLQQAVLTEARVGQALTRRGWRWRRC